MKVLTLLLTFAFTNLTIQSIAQILPPAVADFSYSSCDSFKISFIDQSTGTFIITSGRFWDFGDSTTSTATNPVHTFSQGTYSVTLIATGQANPFSSGSDTITKTLIIPLQAPPSLGTRIRQNEPSPCTGNCDGILNIAASGGTPPYNYLWSNDSTSNLIYACPGVHSVTITDITGCSATLTETVGNTVNQFDVHHLESNAICNGNDGSISLALSGGTFPYSVSFNGDTFLQVPPFPNFTGLAPGNYDILSRDSLGCQYWITVDIGRGNTLPLEITAMNTGCHDSTGAVAVVPSNGLGGYSYAWNTGDTLPNLTGLPSGNYYITVTDTTLCTGIDSVTVMDSCGAVQGVIFDDQNDNGIQDAGELGIPGISILLDGVVSGISNRNGVYSAIASQLDSFTVEILLPPGQYYCSGSIQLQGTVSAPDSGNYSINISPSTPVVTGYNFGIAPPQSPCGTITGHVFDDQNNNGIKDPGELGKAGALISLSNGSYSYTDIAGNYSVNAPLDSVFTVSFVPRTPSYYCSSAPLSQQTFPTSPSIYTTNVTQSAPVSSGNDFGCHEIPFFDVSIYTIRTFAGVNAGQNFVAWMDFKSNGNPSDTCILRLEFDPLVEFISASIPPTAIGNTYIEWEFPTQFSWYCMEMEFNLDSSATAGMPLSWFGSYSCGTTVDGCPLNDTMSRTVTVVSGPVRRTANGFNAMEVFHTGDAAGTITSADSVFSYVITFQNTSSDTAYSLSIRDTISEHLNIKTISVPFSSYPHEFYMPAENVLVWEFENILLPNAATDPINSYGFVQYNILMKPNLPIGTTINNRAAIFINYNSPSLTNETSLILQELTTGINNSFNNSLNIYPNPGSSIFNLVIPEINDDRTFLKVFDLYGKLIEEKKIPSGTTKLALDLGAFENGVYLIMLQTDGKVYTDKASLIR